MRTNLVNIKILLSIICLAVIIAQSFADEQSPQDIKSENIRQQSSSEEITDTNANSGDTAKTRDYGSKSTKAKNNLLKDHIGIVGEVINILTLGSFKSIINNEQEQHDEL